MKLYLPMLVKKKYTPQSGLKIMPADMNYVMNILKEAALQSMLLISIIMQIKYLYSKAFLIS